MQGVKVFGLAFIDIYLGENCTEIQEPKNSRISKTTSCQNPFIVSLFL